MAEDNNKKYLTYGLVIAAVLIGGVMIASCMKKKGASSSSSEGFALPEIPQNMMVEGQMAQPNLAALPVAPRSNLPGLNGQSILGSPQAMGTMAAPPQPVMAASAQVPVDFSSMGGAASAPFQALTSQQAASALQDKVGSGKPDYYEPQLPLQDIGNMSTDPTNPMSPENFMYTRTIFSKLKRRYGNQVDFFRGDLDIAPAMRGYFDIAPPRETDVQKSYFADYIDIQQASSLRDAQYTRSIPSETLYANSISPAGDAYRSVYLNV